MSYALGVVADEKVDLLWVMSLLRLRRDPLWDESIVEIGGPGNFDVARNKVVARFLDTTHEHLLMVDTDMVFDPLDVEALFARNRSFVSGAYVVADDPPRACFAKRDNAGWLKGVQDWKGKGLIEVDALGCGFCLIRRDVFEDIGSPQDTGRFGPWFRQDLLGFAAQALEPDYAFCQRAQGAGHKVYVDTDVLPGHIKPRAIYG